MLLILVIETNIFSQSLVQDNKTWNVVNCIEGGGCWTETFKINGDTTINQINYKKLFSTTDTTLVNWYFYGALREEDDKVFLFYPDLSEETILYDFNLSAGDSFSSSYNGCPFELTLQDIDTVTLLNGEQQEKYLFTDGEEWIKGVGSLNGPIYVGVYWCEADMYYDLSCCFENDEQIFQSENFESCFVLVGIDEKKNIATPEIYPNPFSGSTVLKFNYLNSHDYTLLIINQYGQIIRTINNISSGQIEISKGNMKNGIYFYRLQNEKGIIANGKMIVY